MDFFDEMTVFGGLTCDIMEQSRLDSQRSRHMRVLIIEDEQALAKTLHKILLKHHYLPDMVHTGIDGLDAALSGVYDLIISDIMMPGLDGLSLATQLRKQGIVTPILMLTAKTTTQDKITGLDAGADDYLVKPFDTQELLARLRALSRRSGQLVVDNLLTFHDISYQPQTLQLSCGTQQFKLSLTEGNVLEKLMQSRSIPVSKETLITKVWGYDSDAEDNHVEVYISFLRKKLKHMGAKTLIRNQRNVGYFLAAEDAYVQQTET